MKLADRNDADQRVSGPDRIGPAETPPLEHYSRAHPSAVQLCAGDFSLHFEHLLSPWLIGRLILAGAQSLADPARAAL